ncbi:hypothetical protein NEMBOFW57_000459 [Staphylotrichum longicolle]|uniref:Uncharacterized protein n=1 Tax=Staphylotrichum longicolle TaxID=669026 RepID=A0AAD4EZQ1_9PEZI|nr:hypothetical protein NEMBOFW57_000459 [Staphylotrichum longicolle]
MKTIRPCPLTTLLLALLTTTIHIFAARETTAPPEFGSSRTLVDLILAAFPGPSQATVEAIDYPAAGLTLDEYAASVTAGIAAVVDQTGAFAARCPGSVIVMHGYSQFAARPVGFQCPEFGDRIQSYCDAPDPFCSDGDDPDTHQGYGQEFGQQALEFVISKVGL